MSALGAGGPRARVRASRGWGWRTSLVAVCAVALGAGACNKPLVFTDPGSGAAGGVTGGNNADAGAGGAGRTGAGGVIGTGGTLGSGGTGAGGLIGSGGAGGSIDASVDQRVDVPPDVRDTGPDIRDTGVDIRDTGPITTVVCTTPTDCSSKVAGLTCLVPAGQPGRCVECVGSTDCARNSTAKVCDSVYQSLRRVHQRRERLSDHLVRARIAVLDDPSLPQRVQRRYPGNDRQCALPRRRPASPVA